MPSRKDLSSMVSVKNLPYDQRQVGFGGSQVQVPDRFDVPPGSIAITARSITPDAIINILVKG